MQAITTKSNDRDANGGQHKIRFTPLRKRYLANVHHSIHPPSLRRRLSRPKPTITTRDLRCARPATVAIGSKARKQCLWWSVESHRGGLWVVVAAFMIILWHLPDDALRVLTSTFFVRWAADVCYGTFCRYVVNAIGAKQPQLQCVSTIMWCVCCENMYFKLNFGELRIVFWNEKGNRDKNRWLTNIVISCWLIKYIRTGKDNPSQIGPHSLFFTRTSHFFKDMNNFLLFFHISSHETCNASDLPSRQCYEIRAFKNPFVFK